MTADLFTTSSYRSYLRARIDEHAGERGYQKKLAEAAACQQSYFSQVLNTHIHLTPDQASGLCSFWGFDDEATDFFYSLVALERATAPHLKAFLKRRLATARKRHAKLSHRLKADEVTLSEDRLVYYSVWYHTAVHVLTSVPGFRTVEQMAQRLRLPESLVRSSLQHLERMRLVRLVDGEWRTTEHNLHLESDSPLNVGHHANWRQIAGRALQERENTNGVHYTSLFALSQADLVKLKGQIVQLIAASREQILASSEEVTACFLCDFFEV